MRADARVGRSAVLPSACLLVAVLIAAPSSQATPPAPAQAQASSKLPALTNQEFWRLATELSEPDGTFHSENLVSNEARFQTVIPDLVRVAVPHRAYVGVGSEQNFTYMAAVQPTHAFILDIRRGNLDLHLLYKAFFELSADRADFVARLFARSRPTGLTARSTAAEIFQAFERVAPSRALFDRNLQDAIAHLTRTRGFGLSSGDRSGIEFVYTSWVNDGPNISYRLNGSGGGGGFGGGRRGGSTYASLMTADDGTGRNRSYLATEDAFRFLKDLQARNRVVPVVGNFGGPKALRAVAAYLREQRMTVSVFYTSNVQQYLKQDGIWNRFCSSAATLPMDRSSTMIFSERGGFQGASVPGGGFRSQVAPLRQALAGCSESAGAQ